MSVAAWDRELYAVSRQRAGWRTLFAPRRPRRAYRPRGGIHEIDLPLHQSGKGLLRVIPGIAAPQFGIIDRVVSYESVPDINPTR